VAGRSKLARNARPTFLSLFSGCGGLDLGFEQAGFRCVGATDLEKTAAASFKANFTSVPFWLGSIADLNAAKLASEFPDLAKGLDVLVGGPPCPPFSKSRFYRKDKPRALDDPNGKDTIEGYLRVLAETQPRAFLLENVRGLAYKVHSDALDHIVDTADRLGYTVSKQVLNAADFGVPQIRERFFVIGVREGPFRFPAPTHTREPGLLSDLDRWVTAGDVLADLDTDENADDSGHFAGGQFHHLLRQVPPGDNYLFFTKERGHPSPIFKWRSRYWSFLLKLSPDAPAWTVQARRSNNMGPFHWRNRILRIAEIKRLQTFPDDFALVGTTEQQWRQIGNAVPPLLARHLADAMGAAVSAARPERAYAAG